ncbi:autotransporter outer membrane beta-barrel domain-containing protein [Pseudomonas guariconensis]|nr:autotransporter outer membrane beta-barrel domain-containing protein [Pseudomonas guariconensis]MBF8792395.1 autotransporter outer membrane beta-barrel domain-containing protein [Pseudomonas monteilii]
MAGNYTYQGQPAIVAGAYAYRLYQNGVTASNDGNWYLRSSLENPTPPVTPPVDPPVTPPVTPPITPPRRRGHLVRQRRYLGRWPGDAELVR